jgi:hypothetical protein
MTDTEVNSSTDEIEKEVEISEIEDESVTNDFATPEKQEARTFLRERFLRVITGVVGKNNLFN